MKSILILVTLLFFASCGKQTTTKSTSYSMDALASKGIGIENYNSILYVECISDGSTTNQQRIDALSQFRNSIGVNSSKTLSYTYGNRKISPSEMDFLLSTAISKLQSSVQSAYYNPYSDNVSCPSFVLSQI